MINNRQQNGRRRGRGGPRPMEGRANGGNNRPETRARGNAPQLHEKYKAMARDAQMAGDRVQTEYYLQFADHYYRILNENRPRFDEQRPQQGNGNDQGQSYSADEYDDEDVGEDEQQSRDEGDEAPQRQQPRPRENGYDREARPQRDPRPPREDRPRNDDRPRNEVRPERDVQREDRPQRDARPEREDRPDREDRPERDAAPEAAAPPRAERPRRARIPADRPQAARDDAAEEGPGIDFDRLPPAIARPDPEPEAVANDTGDDRPRPVRRPRRPREGTPVAA